MLMLMLMPGANCQQKGERRKFSRWRPPVSSPDTTCQSSSDSLLSLSRTLSDSFVLPR